MGKQEKQDKAASGNVIRVASALLESTTPYSQGRPVSSLRRDNEPADEYDERIWKERAHVHPSGKLMIPPMAFKNALTDAAQFLGMTVPGKGKATYTKHFMAGLSVVEPLVLEATIDDVIGERIFVPADGRRGSGKRVWRRFPVIGKWSGLVEFIVLDETITEDAFLSHLKAAGTFIGIGRFRPRNNGFYGRFAVRDVSWRLL